MILDVKGEAEGKKHIRFYCPACKHAHSITDKWGWNGSLDKPTFASSVGCNMPSNPHYVPTVHTCHSTVTDGNIYFHSDSTHSLAGQTVAIPHFPENYGLG